MKKIEWWWLILILILGICLRFWQLGETPKGFFCDEASLGYDAYSLLLTGKDQFGKTLPILFRSFVDFKPPFYTLFLIPIYKILGMSIWSTRFLSAMAGMVVIWFSFWIVKGLSKNIRLSLLVALLLAVSPWQIMVSRTSYETNLSLALLMIMIWSFYKSKKNIKWLLMTAIVAGLSFLTYHSERVITPLILLCLIIKERKNVFKKENTVILSLAVLMGLILVLPTVKLMTTPGFLSRLNSLSILSGEVKKPWGFDENLIGWKNLMFNNSVELKLREFGSLYISYFSPRYLFGLGDPGPRSSYPDLAPFLCWQLPFWMTGAVWLMKKNKDKNEMELKFLTVLMMVITPIPAAITRDPFSSIRALPLVLPLIILTAKGWEIFLKKFRVLGKILLVFLIVWSLGKIYLSVFKFNDYFRGYAWEEGIEEMVNQIKEEKLPVVVDNARGEIYSQILFFTQAEPKKYQEENFEVKSEDYYTNMERVKAKQINHISVRPIVWEKDIYKNQILVGDALSINEE
ncbi:MAG: glycosyltransferase family 39 protein, partial [Candidatus Shapirobacteria bacterium]|nr:glycosyltransferase family 39 protein [Candidatus Shapirobacteria bacterium]